MNGYFRPHTRVIVAILVWLLTSGFSFKDLWPFGNHIPHHLTVLFIGNSYVETNKFVHELQEMADQFVLFLDKWFDLFPEYSYDDVSCALRRPRRC